MVPRINDTVFDVVIEEYVSQDRLVTSKYQTALHKNVPKVPKDRNAVPGSISVPVNDRKS